LPAARVTDIVVHEDWNSMTFVTPAATGLAIVITITIVATGGAAALAFAIGGAIGTIVKFIDKFLADGPEKIETGADTVYTNLLPSALAHPKCTVTDGMFVFTGALHVYIEDGRASRFSDRTTCPGTIKSGSKPPFEVLIGGPPAAPHRAPAWYQAYLAIDLAYSAAGLAVSLNNAATAWDHVQNAYDGASLVEGAFEAIEGYKILESPVREGVDTTRSITSGIIELLGKQ